MPIPFFKPSRVSLATVPRVYSDGVTYLEELNNFIRESTRTLEAIEALGLSLPELVSDNVDAKLNEKVGPIATEIQELRAAFAELLKNFSDLSADVQQSIEEIQNSSINITDPVTLAIISDPDSETRAVLDSLYG